MSILTFTIKTPEGVSYSAKCPDSSTVGALCSTYDQEISTGGHCDFYMKDSENALTRSLSLNNAGITNESVLFMLPRATDKIDTIVITFQNELENTEYGDTYEVTYSITIPSDLPLTCLSVLLHINADHAFKVFSDQGTSVHGGDYSELIGELMRDWSTTGGDASVGSESFGISTRTDYETLEGVDQGE